MSILIKGMEMPKSCSVCRLFGEYGCPFIGAVGYALTRDERNEDCPLVPVPPHGLIDREQILDSIRLELAQANAVNDMEDYDSWMLVFDYVRKFPTIIPAEEGER